MKLLDDTGEIRSDEVYIGAYDRNFPAVPARLTKTRNDFDKGEVHNFGSRERCIAAVSVQGDPAAQASDLDAQKGDEWLCNQQSPAGSFRFEVVAWESDDPNFDPGFDPIFIGARDMSDDLIGSESETLTSEELAQMMPTLFSHRFK